MLKNYRSGNRRSSLLSSANHKLHNTTAIRRGGTVGLVPALNKNMSIGLVLSYRTALSGETIYPKEIEAGGNSLSMSRDYSLPAAESIRGQGHLGVTGCVVCNRPPCFQTENKGMKMMYGGQTPKPNYTPCTDSQLACLRCLTPLPNSARRSTCPITD